MVSLLVRLWVEITMPVKNHPQIDVSLLVRLWVEILSVLLYVYKVNVSLLVRLWVEMSITDCNDALDYGQPPCEAVSWNITAAILSPTALGQPPCEAVSWNEQLKDSIQKVTSSASLWGCELKCTVRSGAENCLIVSLLVRLWVEIYCDKETGSVALVSLLVRLWVEISVTTATANLKRVSLLVRLWVEMWIICYWLMRTTCQPPCEAVSWNTSQATQSSLVLLSASLWGCELK